MDQCQNPDTKLHVQTNLKDNCKLDYNDQDNVTSQTKIESKPIYLPSMLFKMLQFI